MQNCKDREKGWLYKRCFIQLKRYSIMKKSRKFDSKDIFSTGFFFSRALIQTNSGMFSPPVRLFQQN